MIDVVWFSENPDAISRGYWDQGWLEHVLDGRMWRIPGAPSFRHVASAEQVEGDGAIVVVPARWHAERWEDVQAAIDRLGWCLLILTGDEEGAFPRHELSHPRAIAWVQTPRPGAEPFDGPERYVGDLWPPDAPGALAELPWDKPDAWFFAGQINTDARRDLARSLRKRAAYEHDGEAVETEAFGAGLDYPAYLQRLAAAKVAPCPGGPFTPDTFRLFEALEAGCLPIVERSPYWRFVFGEDPPLAFVGSWAEARPAIGELDGSWAGAAARASAWFQGHKRGLALRLLDDVAKLSGMPREPDGPGDRITALVPTSSSPADPDTAAIEETVASIEERLPGAEILVMVDGLHPDHAARAEVYDEHRRRVAWLCEHRWHNAWPIVFDEHTHQAGMTRRALTEIRTPHVLFVEHDTPLVGEVDFAALCRALEEGPCDLIRLHHEASVLPDHRHLMLDRSPQDVAGAPLLRTVQWSQRPHLATAAFYRRVIGGCFGEGSRTMIEDVMHGVVHAHWRDFGLAGWERFRLWLYAPPGDIKRSTHLDARGGEAKVPMTWVYDGEPPIGAPAPT